MMMMINNNLLTIWQPGISDRVIILLHCSWLFISQLFFLQSFDHWSIRRCGNIFHSGKGLGCLLRLCCRRPFFGTCRQKPYLTQDRGLARLARTCWIGATSSQWGLIGRRVGTTIEIHREMIWQWQTCIGKGRFFPWFPAASASCVFACVTKT